MSTLSHSAPFITHDSDPLYLANGCFGGFQDLSGTQMDLWSSSIASRNLADPEEPTLYPITALRTAVWFRNAHYREQGFWVGRDGMITEDERYTADPAMPHLPQVYHARQELDLDRGVSTVAGTLYPGSQAALEAGMSPERSVAFEVQTLFLKDSKIMRMEILADEDCEILFSPEFILEERRKLLVTGHGVCQIGSAIDSDLHLKQEMLEETLQQGRLELRMKPEGANSYRIRILVAGGEAMRLQERPALRCRGRMEVIIQINPEDHPMEDPPQGAALLRQQEARWAEFWSRSRVSLPESEALWQERYQASLFYVEQSIGEGPTHPGGLSKPNYPHWYGCFHDTDTYFCRPLMESSRPEGPHRHLDFRLRTLAKAREIAERHDKPGAQYAWQSDLNGEGSDHHSVMNASIVAAESALQLRMHGDAGRKAGVTELVEESFRYLMSFTEERDGVLKLQAKPLLTFSETMEVSEPTEALLGLRAVAEALLELSEHAELRAAAERVLAEVPVPRHDQGGYQICPDGDPEYMRCPSVTLGSFPLHCLHGNEDLEKSFELELSKIMFVFAWLPHQQSIVAAMLQRREGPSSAVGLLRQADAFYRPWHAFDEWENRRTGRADHFITAAGGFASAIHHLLLAETTEGIWSLFPATPPDWKELSFKHLVTRNGWQLSASMKEGTLEQLEATPLHDQAAAELNVEFGGEIRIFRR